MGVFELSQDPAPAPARCDCGAHLRDGDAWCWLCYERVLRPGEPAAVETAHAAGEETAPPASSTADSSVAPTVVGCILVAAVAYGVTTAWIGEFVEPAKAIRYGIIATLAVYAVVSAAVFAHAAVARSAPRWSVGSPAAGAGIGFGIGAVLSGFIVMASAAAGGNVAEPVLFLELSEGGWLRLATVAFIVVVVAPLVEELLFRGLLMEALRPKGTKTALAATAVAFAVWHLDPSALRYYAIAGVLLGLVYLRFGLSGSIAAHAAFNGVLLVAVLVTIGSGVRTVDAGGLTFELPGRWVDAAQAERQGVDYAAAGPSGAVLLVEHWDTPGGSSSAQQVADGFVAQPVPAPGLEVHPATVEVAEHATGDIVRMRMDIEGRRADVVVLPAGGRLWVVTLVGAGSRAAYDDFEGVVATMSVS